MYDSPRYIQLSLGNSCYFFGKELLTLLVICSFCGCLIVFYLSSPFGAGGVWGVDGGGGGGGGVGGLDVDLIVSVPEFSYSI